MTRGSRGFTVASVLIGSVIGIFLIGGMITAYMSGTRALRTQEALARIQEAGRFVSTQLESDLRMAGFRGCNSDFIPVTNTLARATDLAFDFTRPLAGFTSSASTWTPTLDAMLAAASPAPSLGSDVIVIRRTVGLAQPVRAAMSASTGDVTADASTFASSQIVLVSDCTSGAIFQITNADAATTGLLAHATGTGSPGNASADLGRRYNGDAQVRRLSTISYYVAPSTSRPGMSSLWRVVAEGAAEEVMDGVERMVVRYGLDTDDDRTVNRYVAASGVADFSTVVNVRVSLVLASADEIGTGQSYEIEGTTITPADRRLRRVFTSTTSIRNKVL